MEAKRTIADSKKAGKGLRNSRFFLPKTKIKTLTPCPISTYEKQTLKFDSIRAIWRTIGAISRAIREQFALFQEQFETIGAIPTCILIDPATATPYSP